MTWTRLDDAFTDHPKIVAAGPLAGWLHVCALVYCNRLLTDGFIPQGQIRKLADVDNAPALVRTLVEVGLWDQAENGYRIHDFFDYNMTAEEVKLKREEISQKRAEAGRKGGLAKKQSAKQVASDLQSKQGSKTVAPSRTRTHPLTHTHPDQPENAPGGAGLPQREQFTGFFDSFWEAYPRRNGIKVGKQEARENALKLSPAEYTDVLQAVHNYAASGERPKDAKRFLLKDYWRGWLDVQPEDQQTQQRTNGNGQHTTNNRFDSHRRLADSIAKETKALALESPHLELLSGGKQDSPR